MNRIRQQIFGHNGTVNDQTLRQFLPGEMALLLEDREASNKIKTAKNDNSISKSMASSTEEYIWSSDSDISRENPVQNKDGKSYTAYASRPVTHISMHLFYLLSFTFCIAGLAASIVFRKRAAASRGLLSGELERWWQNVNQCLSRPN